MQNYLLFVIFFGSLAHAQIRTPAMPPNLCSMSFSKCGICADLAVGSCGTGSSTKQNYWNCILSARAEDAGSCQIKKYSDASNPAASAHTRQIASTVCGIVKRYDRNGRDKQIGNCQHAVKGCLRKKTTTLGLGLLNPSTEVTPTEFSEIFRFCERIVVREGYWNQQNANGEGIGFDACVQHTESFLTKFERERKTTDSKWMWMFDEKKCKIHEEDVTGPSIDPFLRSLGESKAGQ